MSGRNRRKPLAPQWVNPADWTADRAEDLVNKVMRMMMMFMMAMFMMAMFMMMVIVIGVVNGLTS